MVYDHGNMLDPIASDLFEMIAEDDSMMVASKTVYTYIIHIIHIIHIQSIYPSSIVGRKPFQKIPGENVG